MIAIKVYNSLNQFQYLDLTPGTQLSIEETLPSFDQNLESGLFSLPIDIPWTPKNKLFLGFAENFNTINSNIPEFWRCDIEVNSIPFLIDGKLKMISHKGRYDYKEGSYSFTITGIKGYFGSVIKNKKLRDLNLGGPIRWDVGKDSREFAYDVMTGAQPIVFEKLKFAPVAILNFIDSERNDFNTEYLLNDIVNNTIIDATLPNGWIFGRNDPAAWDQPVAKGLQDYDHFRTVPFLSLFFVLKSVFTEFGFIVSGSFFDYPQFDQIHIYNTVALDRFDYPFTEDYNTQIIPSRHLPDMLLADFLTAICLTFNLKLDFEQHHRVIISFNQDSLTSQKVINLTSKCTSTYEEAKRHEIYEDGFKIEWGWDQKDSYASDRVKDLREIDVIAEVDMFTDIAGLTITPAPDETSYIFVKKENYYYNYEPASSTWIPLIENLDDIREGKEQTSFAPQLAPMCSYYKDDGLGNVTRQNIVAAHQKGNYYNDAKIFVENEFGLRLFYIGQFSAGSYTDLPLTFCHHTDSNGVKLASASLAWAGEKGLYNLFWKKWIDMLYNSWSVNSKFDLSLLDILSIRGSDLIISQSSQYLIKKINYNLPAEELTEMELVKL